MFKTFLLTGGNLGDRRQSLATALELLELQCGIIVEKSSIYETAAWGNENQPSFLNQAIQLETMLTAVELLEKLLGIERKMGRSRNEKYGARVIDIDILLYGDEISSSPLLVIPHPQMQYRRFVLAPLAEIAPRVIHPVLRKSIATLLQECEDPLPVRRLVD